MSVCFRCGEPVPQDARFCPSCGAPQSEDRGGEERKLVTVLFADLARSTELANRLDPERFREVMVAFYRAASDELASLRGRPEKFAGDAVMAVFGLPYAHEDDALRAVRAGLRIRDRVERLGGELGLDAPLRIRVGVNTGAVVASGAPAGELLVSGAAVNLAARLQQAAEPGEVLVGETTWQVTRDAAGFGSPRTVDAKGFAEPVPARPVLSLSPRSSRRTIPLVGRRREHDLLMWASQRSAEASRAHLVTLLGEAGIGKSRLVQELMAAVPEEAEVLFGRAGEFSEDPVFSPLVDLVRRRLGVGAEADPESVGDRLAEVVTGCCDPSDADRVTAQLGLLLGLGEEGRQGTPYRAAEIRAGLLSFLEALARRGPVVLVLEDLHLARAPLLDLVEEMVRGARRLPLVVVAVAREELIRTRPAWGTGLPDAMAIRLEPLTFAESRELARAAAAAIDDATAERIAGEAGGNPFFIIETTGMLLHEADAHTHGGRPARTGLPPPTVQAVVASRIDHLPEAARTLVRMASIFPGGAFGLSELALVAEADRDVLATLEEEEVLVRDEDRPRRWLFRHELLREVAYDSLPKRERRRLHELVADRLAGSGEDAPVRHVAHHLEQAALAALDLDPADREPARRAEAALQRAGDVARRKVESRAALDLYERALALAGPEDGWGIEEGRILAGMGEARYWLGDYEAADAALERALAVAGDDPWTRTHALRFAADIALNIRGEVDGAESLFADALSAADALGDPWATARTLLMAGWVPYWRDDLAGAKASFERALAVARENPQGDWWGEARALISLAGVRAASGQPRPTLELADRALALGREHGDAFTVATAQERRSTSLRAMWRLDDALSCSNEAVAGYRDLGARWELASALGDRGVTLRLLGKLEDSEADLKEAFDLCAHLGDRVLVQWTASELATTLLLLGRRREAGAALDDPALAGATPLPSDQGSLLWARSYLALWAGDHGRARRLALEALEVDRRAPGALSGAIGVWWAGSLFGAEAVGGPEAMDRARTTLEREGWVRPFREVEQIREALAAMR